MSSPLSGRERRRDLRARAQSTLSLLPGVLRGLAAELKLTFHHAQRIVSWCHLAPSLKPGGSRKVCASRSGPALLHLADAG
jgi:hypothetical protein